MASKTGSLPGQTLAGRYEIRDLLGAGGMGAVYHAHRLALRRDVAVKTLPSALTDEPGSLERFNHEAKIAAQLEHPHIISIYDFGSENGLTYIIYVATQYADVSDGSMPNEVFVRRLAGAMGREAESG